MATPEQPAQKNAPIIRSLLLTMVVASLAVYGGLRSCQQDDPNAISEIPTIRSSAEYNQILDRVERLTAAGLERSSREESLSKADRLAMQQAEPLIKGLIAYDYQRFTHYLMLAKLYFANEKYLEALWACNQLFERAPAHGTPEVIAAVAETRYVASRSYYFERQYLEAAAEGKEAVKRMPQSAEYMWAEAAARVQLEQIEEAKLLLGTALFLEPNHVKSRSLLDFLEKPSKVKNP